MKFIDLVKLSTRMFKARTSRTLLTILGMGIGMATILFLVSFGFGVRDVILERMTTPDSLASVDVRAKGQDDFALQKAAGSMEKMKEVKKIIPVMEYKGKLKVGDSSVDADFFAAQPGYLSMNGIETQAGKPLSKENEKGIILSSSYLKVLEKTGEELIGSRVGLILHVPRGEGKFEDKELASEFNVAGIVEAGKSEVYLNSSALEGQVPENVVSLKVRANDPGQVESLIEKVTAMGFSASSVSEIVDQIRKFFSVASFILAVFGVIALVVSAIGMFNTMIVALLERTEEIGVMKSIGATDGNILSIFIFESTLMGILGGAVGIAMGFIAQFAANYIFNIFASNMGGQAFDLFFTPGWFLLLLFSFAAAVGFVTGLIPAKRASAVDPLEALRYR
ncbi:MAG: FtsX-like permease family protein [Candidatus Moranbacteria bacterium]|nr:FtsX-like permease family protein [Candidatus Moranbacteria bacterium]